jgi:hypothetical protein
MDKIQVASDGQLAAEATRRFDAEALATETIQKIKEVTKEAEDTKLEIRKSMIVAEEWHASDMAMTKAGGSLRTSTRPRLEHNHLQGECSYRHADRVHRFNGVRVLVLVDPNARRHTRRTPSASLRSE